MTGELCRIVYRNDNNFLIGSFQGPAGMFTAIGSIINPQVNMEYALTGEWQDTSKYGQQFKFSRYQSVQPVDANGIFKYIVRTCKFVGSTVGNRLLDAYGDQTLVIMKTDPDRVAMETPGITLERAKEIQKTLIDNEQNESVMVELEALLDVQGMRKSLAGELIHAFGNNAGDVVRGNPYTLTHFHGIGFALADRVALNLEYPRDGIERKKAATVHAMGEVVKEGSIWIDKPGLVEKVRELIQISKLEEGVEALLEDETMVEVDGDVAFTPLANDETMVAEMLAALEVSV
ncbi:MAG: hypothetical protein JEZ12_16070 [Desulfobacterium sp.]|nr:hypothetical protein [Desulfobacterium sp.]